MLHQNNPAQPVDGFKSRGVFVVAIAALIFLWLPALPYEISITRLPSFLANLLVKLGISKADEVWKMRWDYIGIPLLVPCALALVWKSHVNAEEAGLTMKNFWPACRYLLLPTFVGICILVVIGYSTHPVEWSDRFFKRLIPIPAFFQQVVIQLFFHRLLFPWYGKTKRTALLVTVYFVALHAPNPGLMIGTLFGMYFWARCFQLHPNLYALALSHALLSAVLMQTMPKWLLPSVSVGARFVEKGMKSNWWGWF